MERGHGGLRNRLGGADFSLVQPATSERGNSTMSHRRRGETGHSLYDPTFEHDACGVGFVARVSGQQDHDLLVKALQSVANVTHRGAVDADLKTGDGAGVLTQLPYRLLLRETAKLGAAVSNPADLALGMLFLPEENQAARAACCAI